MVGLLYCMVALQVRFAGCVSDSRRAAALLEEFCAQLQACDDPGHVATLRATIEMLRSDLFLQLVDIQRDHYNVSILCLC